MNEAKAVIYRMVMEKHTCPHGLKALDLMKRRGLEVEDRHLTTREAVEAFKQEHGVKTTPQAWIGSERVGGYSDLKARFGDPLPAKGETSYQPVIAIFSVAFLMALALNFAFSIRFPSWQVIEWFVAISVCLLAVQKLQDVEKFSTMFLNYDLLAMRWVPYSRIYPYAEALSGILMLTGAFIWLAAPLMLFIGTVGAVSVFKAVYIDRRELKCACVGGDTNVPLGFVSLTENLFMVGMGVWMLVK